ncbi:hypothetical protein IW150_000543 [Coemansia sp. RSA 2607]|nr:hypothetical protein IW150_000543 [Coemansia sp. RSA 2607]
MRLHLLSLYAIGLAISGAQWTVEPFGSVAHTAVEASRLVSGMRSLDGQTADPQRLSVLRRRTVQHDFSDESDEDRSTRRARAAAVKHGFQYAWAGYKKYAYGADELDVLAKKPKTTRNGWGATLIDALDTLWAMDLKDEFWEARELVAKIDFHKDGGQLAKVFETVIRYLGGLLSAYELSQDKIFLQKATEVANAMLPAFNTPLGLPWQMLNVTSGVGSSETPGKSSTNLAEIGTFQMEFFRLSQLTRNGTYHEIAQNIISVMLAKNSPTDGNQNYVIPGLYPIDFDMLSGKFTGRAAYWGGGADSFYEYLGKTWILSDFMLERNRELWTESIQAFNQYAVAESNRGYLFTGFVDGAKFYPYTDTFTNFIPGTLGLLSKIVGSNTYFQLAVDLLEGAHSVFDEMPSSLGAEAIRFVRKNVPSDYLLLKDKAKKQIDQYGFANEREYYLLRPEYIESLFYMYRMTGNTTYADRVWKVWQGIQRNCRADEGYVGTADVSVDASVSGALNTVDSTESFFYAETFKYLYLTFADHNVLSLDDWVFTTEAHPLSRKIPFDGTF